MLPWRHASLRAFCCLLLNSPLCCHANLRWFWVRITLLTKCRMSVVVLPSDKTGIVPEARACQDLEKADNDTVSVISVERNYLFFKWLHSSLLRTLHGNCHNATFLSVATSAITPDGFYYVEQSKVLDRHRKKPEVLGFFLNCLSQCLLCLLRFWIAKDLRWLWLILGKLA